MPILITNRHSGLYFITIIIKPSSAWPPIDLFLLLLLFARLKTTVVRSKFYIHKRHILVFTSKNCFKRKNCKIAKAHTARHSTYDMYLTRSIIFLFSAVKVIICHNIKYILLLYGLRSVSFIITLLNKKRKGPRAIFYIKYVQRTVSTKKAIYKQLINNQRMSNTPTDWITDLDGSAPPGASKSAACRPYRRLFHTGPLICRTSYLIAPSWRFWPSRTRRGAWR